MTDTEKMDEICAAFTKALIQNKMDDQKSYLELAQRLANILDAEIKWQLSKEEERILMSSWGPLVN